MKTDELITMLSTGAQPVPRFAAERLMGIAVVTGGALSLLMLFTFYGVRPDLREVSTDIAYWMKIGIPMANALIGFFFVRLLARPGKRPQVGYWIIAIPILLLWSWALSSWVSAAPVSRPELLWGETWQVCVLNIMFLALPIGAATLFALRHLAPTQPTLTGAMAGWFAGNAGASVYALHCPEMAAPFLAVWYVIGMILPAVIMAFLGSRYLRW